MITLYFKQKGQTQELVLYLEIFVNKSALDTLVGDFRKDPQ